MADVRKLVRYKDCSDVESRAKLLVTKVDSLSKHAGRRKALYSICDMRRVTSFPTLVATSTSKMRAVTFPDRGGDSVVQQASGSRHCYGEKETA